LSVIRGRLSLTSPAIAASSLLLLLSCSDGGGPSDPPDPLNLSVVVRVDSSEFRSEGEFELGLIPFDRTGSTFLNDDWTITPVVSDPTTVEFSVVGSGLQPADTQPVATAVLIDDSGSMRFSDPDRLRAFAAQRFWEEVLTGRPDNVVALLDFGRGDAEPTPGFTRTTVLAGFTEDPAVLEAALPQVQAVPGGATPLYQSGLEVLRWIDSTIPSTYQRTLLVITDGAPSDTDSVAQILYDEAQALRVRVFAVGVGAAGEDNPPSEAAQRLLELAVQTGGIYGAGEPPTRLQPILQTLAQSTSPERLAVRIRLSPAPARGTRIRGTVGLEGERGAISAPWTFVAP
jgi:hypothetical protein